MPDPASAAVGWGMKAAGWVASPIISELYKKGSAFLGFGVSEKLKELERKALLLERVMEVVEESPHRPRLEQLINDLKSAFYEAQDILDDVEYHRLEKEAQEYELNSDDPPRKRMKVLLKQNLQKFKSLTSSPITNKETGTPNIQLRKSLEKIESAVNEAHKILETLNLSCASEGNRRHPTAAKSCTTAISPVKVIGRDEDRDKIVAILHEKAGHGQTSTSSDLCYSVVGIHGLGGSGKTTLAQFVYDQEKKDKQADKDGHFDSLMWIHVSQNYEMRDIYMKMFEAIEGRPCSEFASLDTLQEILMRELSGKRFFLVLDDVWCNKDVADQNLPQLLSPLKVGKRGSKILVTSRNKEAFSELGPDVRYTTVSISDLDDSKFLELLMYHALGDRTTHDDGSMLWNIGAQIAKMLYKSPLAASTVGGQLRKDQSPEFWRTTRDRNLGNETMSALSWSYQHLSEKVRRCFAFCSMFPRGRHFRRDELVKLWVAEGFITSTNAGEEMEDVGVGYFDELVSISFLQLGKEPWGEDYCLMHDLVHKLAEMIAGSDSYRIEKGWTGEVPPSVHHLYIDAYDREKPDLKTFDLENLHTLVIKNIKGSQLMSLTLLFKNMFSRLRVLTVCADSVRGFGFPESIDCLKHLRHLTFRMGPSSCLHFPSTFEKLHHIQTLDFGSCRNFGCNRFNLVSLRHASSQFIPRVNIARSKSLQKLRNFPVTKEQYNKIKQLRDLNKLRGRMGISGLRNVESKEEALEAMLADKKKLTSLVLSWNHELDGFGSFCSSYDYTCNPEVELEVLDCLCPSKDLEKLELRNYGGTIYPSWMVGVQNRGPERLQVLELRECSFLGHAPIFGVFTHLRVLKLRCCKWVTLPDNMEHLKSLRKLSIVICPNIQSLPVLPQSLKNLSIERCLDIQSLPVILPQSLKKLSVSGCPNIQSLPVILPQSLKKLSVSGCPNIQSLPVLPQSLEEFELQWPNEETEPSNRMKGVRFDDDVSIIGA